MSPVPARSESSLRGIALMVLAVALFACLDATAKWLGQTMHSVEVAWLRYATNVLVLCLAFRVWRDLSPFRTAHPVQQLLRGLTLVGSTAFNFWALQYLQLAEANAIMFAGPLLVTALAGPMLGERVGLRRWIAVIVGFVGVLVVLRPGASMHWAYGLSLIAMTTNSFYSLLTRRMHRTETSQNMLMLGTVVGAVVLSPIAPNAVAAVDGDGLTILLAFALGIFGAAGHAALISAHRIAGASTLAPFGYAQMPMMIVFGWVLFHQFPDVWVLVGTLIIAGSGLYILHRERVQAKALASDAEPPVD